MTVNRSLENIAQRFEQELASLKAKNVQQSMDGDNIKFKLQKQVVSNSAKGGSNKQSRFTKITEHIKTQQTKKRPDPSENILLDNWKSGSDIKIKILYLLKQTRRPITYHEIAEHLSQDSPDYDYDSILKELDQLEKKGDIIGQVAAGKLYFQIKH